MNPTDSLYTVLSPLSDAPLVARLFFASVEMALLATLVWTVLRLGPVRSARLTSILWLLVLVKPLAALVVGAPLAIIRLQPPESPVAPAIEFVPEQLNAIPSFELDSVPPPITVDPGPVEAAAPARRSFSWKWSAMETIAGMWIIGAILVGLYAIMDRIRVYRLVARGAQAPSDVAAQYRAIAASLRVKRPPKLRVTDALESPALVGTIVPTVLLPVWLTDKTGTVPNERVVRQDCPPSANTAQYHSERSEKSRSVATSRSACRDSSLPLVVQNDTIRNPHPNPLPAGEGTESRASVMGGRAYPRAERCARD